MKKSNLVTAIIAGSLLTTPLFASNLAHKLMPGKTPLHSASNLRAKSLAKDEAGSYTDFSGRWKGNCTYPDIALPEGDGIDPDDVDIEIDNSVYFTIENDDSYFRMDGEVYKIGVSFNTEAFSDEVHAGVAHSSIEWNHDKSVLMIDTVSLLKEYPSIYIPEQSKKMDAYMHQSTLSLNDGKLILHGQSKNLLQQDSNHRAGYTCTLSKLKD